MKNSRTFTTKRIVIDALFAAMYICLSYLSISFGRNVKITFESLPIIIGALMFGPIDGLVISFVGTLVQQLTGPYGITPTIPLFMLPYVAAALITGFAAKKCGYKNNNKQIMVLSFAANLVIFILNSLAIYVDSKLYGYYSPAIWASAGIRFIIAIPKSLLYGLIIPPILNAMAKVTGRRH